MTDILSWIRFALTALLMVCGLFLLMVGVAAQFRFKYVLNRMHAASMGDSLGLLCVLLALCISAGDVWLIFKYLLVVLFLWVTSPTASHLIARLEISTNEHIRRHMETLDMTEGDSKEPDNE